MGPSRMGRIWGGLGRSAAAGIDDGGGGEWPWKEIRKGKRE